MSARPQDRLVALDGVRGMALILLLWSHFFPGGLFEPGLVAIELFFVLSGRFMADILYVQRSPILEFFFRRASRIVPGLIGFVVVWWVIAYFLGPPYQMSPLWVGSAFTFSVNYVSLYTHVSGWFDHLWTLAVEEHSYITLGLLAALIARRIRLAILIIGSLALVGIVNGAVGMGLLGYGWAETYWRTDTHFGSIFLGSAGFLLMRHVLNQDLVARYATPIFTIGMILGFSTGFFVVPIWINASLGTLCFALAIPVLELTPRAFQMPFSNRLAVQTGLVSYSVYLWQQPFYKIDELHPGYPVLWLAAAVVAGLMQYFLLERPARRYLNRNWRIWFPNAPRAPVPVGKPLITPAAAKTAVMTGETRA